MSTKKSTAKATPVKKTTKTLVTSVKKAAPVKKVAAKKKITPVEVQAVKKSVAKKKAAAVKKTPTAEANLKDLIVRMAYTYIPDVMAKTAAEVDNWKEFVEQIETYLEASLVNVLPKPEEK